jgi:CRISPR-associated protein Csx3
MLPAVLDYIPSSTPLSVYGPGPHWLYGALAAHALPASFYQFDPRFPRRESSPGWLAPPDLVIGTQKDDRIALTTVQGDGYVRLSINILQKHLDYLRSDRLNFPPLPEHCGLVLDGSVPSWLLTALLRLYASGSEHATPSWIACYQPQIGGAVIIYSHTATYPVGNIVALA